jgi:hypothetical protein
MAISRDPQKLYITIDNISPADAIALMKMFKHMEYLGEIGRTRNCTFLADGDGAFRPKVSFVYPIGLPEVPEVDGVLKDNSFRIDSDAIAWRIYHDPEPERYQRPPRDEPGALRTKDHK